MLWSLALSPLVVLFLLRSASATGADEPDSGAAGSLDSAGFGLVVVVVVVDSLVVVDDSIMLLDGEDVSGRPVVDKIISGSSGAVVAGSGDELGCSLAADGTVGSLLGASAVASVVAAGSASGCEEEEDVTSAGCGVDASIRGVALAG